MNKLLIEITANGFNLIIEGRGEESMFISNIDKERACMLMSAGIKLKQSEHAGEFLAQFLDEN